MSKQPPLKVKKEGRPKRRRFTEEFKAEAVQMLLDGHAAGSICARLGLSSPNVLTRWKRDAIRQGGTGGDGAGRSRAGARSGTAARGTRARHLNCYISCSLSLDSALHFRPRRVSDVYAGIDQVVLTESFSASAVCDALEVSRSGFYAWRSEAESQREAVDRELTPEIVDIFWHHRRRYGARRIAVALSQRGIACGVARVARLLKNQGLAAIQPKSFRPRTTESRHHLGYNENLLKDGKASLRVDEVWVGDKQPSPAEPWRGLRDEGGSFLRTSRWPREHRRGVLVTWRC